MSNTSPDSSAFVSSTTSGFTSDASHAVSFASSFRCLPCRPRSIECVRSYRSLYFARDANRDTHRSSRGKSSRRSSSHGVWRNSHAFCCRNTLMPPKNTRPWLTSVSSVRMGV